MKLVYSKLQIIRAAKYIWKHNGYAMNFPYKPQGWEDIAENIEASLLRYAGEVKDSLKKGKDWRLLSTGGWTVFIILEDDYTMMAEVTVDPAVCKEKNYIQVKV